MHIGANQFYTLVAPYCNSSSGPVHFSASSGYMTCNEHHHILREGVNLVTLFSTNLYTTSAKPKSCVTHHHFFAYVNGSFVLIADTWLGGNHGQRYSWRRIMQTAHFQEVLDSLKDESDDNRTELLKTYFFAPSKATAPPYKESGKLQVFSINNVDKYPITSASGVPFNDNLDARIIRYAFAKRPGMGSLHRSNSMTSTKSTVGKLKKIKPRGVKYSTNIPNTRRTHPFLDFDPLDPDFDPFNSVALDNFGYDTELGIGIDEPSNTSTVSPVQISQAAVPVTPGGGGKRTHSKTRKYRRNRITRKKRTLGKKKGKKRKTRK